jgi:ribosomal protein S27AE
MNTKVCRGCKVEKAFSEFKKKTPSKDGLEARCRECFAKYYEANKERIRTRQRKAWKEFSIANSEKLREKGKAMYSQSKEQRAEYRKAYKKEFAPKVHAKSLVKSKITKGEIMKQPCEKCGEVKVDAHHDDYAKPLDVRWLCRRHHMAWHADNGEAPNGRAALKAVGVEGV